jgi:SHS2 domain-containing protein
MTASTQGAAYLPSFSTSAAAGRHHPRHPPSEAQRALALLPEGKGAPATKPHLERFEHVSYQTLAANQTHDLGELIVVTGDEALVIVEADDGFALTAVSEGNMRLRNACQILFRHAYQHVAFHIELESRAVDVHVGLLRHTTLTEVQALTVHKPRVARAHDGSRLRHTIDYCAPPLEEVQGIVWRGGNMRISHIQREP